MIINLDRARSIEGWMTEPELQFLAEAASKSTNIVEIGSWMGRSTSAIAANTEGKVLAVDTWRGSIEGVHIRALAGKPENWLFDTFKHNMAGLNNVTALRAESLVAAQKLIEQNVKFDMIFIDASHDYFNVKADILAWKHLLSEGGIFCGHDYAKGWPGVCKAVDEVIGNVKIISTIWVAQ